MSALIYEDFGIVRETNLGGNGITLHAGSVRCAAWLSEDYPFNKDGTMYRIGRK